MKTYVVTLDSKNPDINNNTLESIHIAARNFKEALKLARSNARKSNQVVVLVKVKK